MLKKSLSVSYIAIPLLIGILLGVWQVRPLVADETSDSFHRMMYNIERWTQRPRYVGSDEIKRVRAEIIAEIEAMGLVVVTHDVTYTRDEVRQTRLLRGSTRILHDRHFVDDILHLQNIFVKLETPGADKAIMFVSHYDSFFGTPGAGDAMLPIAAMLEAMRYFADDRILNNNIYFLLTDGEEIGALGALGFIRDHPELKDRVAMVVNLEARGNAGVPILFEASPGPHSMVSMYRRAVSMPVGFSLAATIYETQRYITDFCFFLQYGWTGINFAIIEGGQHYHQPSDTFENLDRNTAWTYLATIMDLAQYVAYSPLNDLQQSSADAVFFPFFRGHMVVIGYSVAYILCAISCLLSLVYLVTQYRKDNLYSVDVYGQRKISSPIKLMVILMALSVISAIFVHSGSYLFWIPLFAVTITALFKEWIVIWQISQALSIIITSLLWAPLIYLFGAMNMWW